jgi:hypothetical protein
VARGITEGHCKSCGHRLTQSQRLAGLRAFVNLSNSLCSSSCSSVNFSLFVESPSRSQYSSPPKPADDSLLQGVGSVPLSNTIYRFESRQIGGLHRLSYASSSLGKYDSKHRACTMGQSSRYNVSSVSACETTQSICLS